MTTAYICQGVRSPIGRYGGALAMIRTDDLAAHPLITLRNQFPNADWESIDEVVFGNANQAGEDNRNVARMALLLAGIPHSVPGVTVNRLCASGLEAVAVVSGSMGAGEIRRALAGVAEGLGGGRRVLPKAPARFPRTPRI